MASKKVLKKKVKGMVFEILNDCDFITMTDSKNAEKADNLMDEAVDFHDEIISKINNAKTKKDYNEIKESLGKAEIDFVKKLNAL